MKKLLFMIAIAILAMSSMGCYVDVYDTVKDPKAATTISIQDNIDTSKMVAIIGHDVYIINRGDNLVYAKATSFEKGCSPIDPLGFVLALIVCFVLGILVFASPFD